VRRYVKASRTVRAEHDFKQTRRGRPGPDTSYRRITHRRYDLEWTIDAATVACDEKSDGMYPLITNDRLILIPRSERAAYGAEPCDGYHAGRRARSAFFGSEQSAPIHVCVSRLQVV
jgi:hypothetical protein